MMETHHAVQRLFRIKIVPKCFDKIKEVWTKSAACGSCKRDMSGFTLPRREFKITKYIES